MVDESSIKYIIENNVPVPILEVIVDNEHYLINPMHLTKYYNEPLYTKDDAQYKVLIDRVSAGTSIKNFEDAKFSKYLERAKKENPEIFFLKN